MSSSCSGIFHLVHCIRRSACSSSSLWVRGDGGGVDGVNCGHGSFLFFYFFKSFVSFVFKDYSFFSSFLYLMFLVIFILHFLLYECSFSFV